ncbi:MAG: efflux RND transporter periplasmic adaptor subunit [Acidobacteria bacterium]|nr:efflux RND transporter periplasmic adaptor subunit [Acidobacteriota bacterium]
MAASLDELKIDRSRNGRSWVGRIVWLVLLLVVTGAGAAAGWRWWEEARIPVVSTAAVRQTVAADGQPTVLNASGYVTARLQSTVSSKVTGRIVEVLVEEGMAVTEGQVLARLDDTTERSYLALAEAQLGAARGALAELEVRYEEARLDLDRQRRLLEQRLIGQADLDAAQAEADSLRARIGNQREQVVVAEREIDVRRTALEDTVIRAPFSGVAISKDAQPGEMISPVSAGGGFTRTGVCTIVDMSSLEIEVDVNESYINRVSPAQRVVATLDAYPDWEIPASVITTIPAADRQRATVLVRIAFDELGDPRILPDMGINVAFLEAGPPPEETVADAAPRFWVPAEALRNDGGTQVVFVARGDTVERRAVTTGLEDGGDVEVLAGVAAGERVVIEGPAELADGDRVVAD